MTEFRFTARHFDRANDRSDAGHGPWANSWYPAWMEGQLPQATDERKAYASPDRRPIKEHFRNASEMADQAMKQALMDCYNG